MDSTKLRLIALTNSLHKVDATDEDLAFIATLHPYIKEDEARYWLPSTFRSGLITLSAEGSAYMQVFGVECKDLYIEADALHGAVDGDIVIAKRELSRRGRASAVVVHILGQAERYSVAYIDGDGAHQSLKDFKTQQPVGVALDASKTYVNHDVFSINMATSSIIEHLGNLNDPAIDKRIALAFYNKHDAFETPLLEMAKSFTAPSYDEIEQRVDLRVLNFCTIDPITAKDFDDAIFFDPETKRLIVAIADVSHYVTPFGAIDQEAIFRAFSIYFPHRSVPMLPRALSETLCSLQPHVERLAFVCDMSLDDSCEQVRSSTFYEAVIHSKRRFTYEEVDSIFEGRFTPDTSNIYEAPIIAMLKALKPVTDRLKVLRMKEGFEFRSPDLNIELDDAHQLCNAFFAEETPSHALIEDCMLLANKEAAKRFDRGVFRIHEAPSNAKIQALFNELAAIGITIEPKNSTKESIYAIQRIAQSYGLQHEVDTLLIRAQMQARYLPYNKGHFGLGFKAYTHFTSPIRRYADLIVHRLIKAQLNEKSDEYQYVLRNIETLSSSISEKEREASSVEMDFKKRKFARWAHQHTNKIFTAKVIATQPEYLAQIEDVITGITVTLIVHEHIELFDTVEIEITKADLITTKIEAVLMRIVNKVQKIFSDETL